MAAIDYFTGFEAGDFSECGGTVGAPTIDSSVKRIGGFSLKCVSAATFPRAFYPHEVFTGGLRDELFIRFWLRAEVSANPSGTVSNQPISTAAGNVGTVGGLYFTYNTDGTITGSGRVNGGGTAVGSTFSVPKDQWVRFEIRVVRSSSAGVLTITMNGSVVVNGSSLNTGTDTEMQQWRFAGPPNTNTLGATVYFDDAAIGSSAPPSLGQSILRLVESGSPTYNAWTKQSGGNIDPEWDDLPFNASNNARSSAASQAQTAHVAASSAGTDPIASQDVINACGVAVIAKRVAPATIALRGSAVVPSGNPTTSFTVVIPSQVVTGDACFLLACSRDSTGLGSITCTDDDSGGNTWSLIGNSTDHKLTLWYKRATSATASKTVTFAGAVGSSSGVLKCFSGATLDGDPYTNVSTPESNASGDETNAGFTPSFASSMICAGVVNTGNDNAVTSMSFATAGATTMTEKLSMGGNDCATAFGHVAVAGGPTGTGNLTWAQTNGTTVSIVWAIKAEQPGTYKIRRRLNGSDTDSTKTLTDTDAFYKDGPWTDTIANLDAAEIGGFRDSGGDQNMQIEDAYLTVDYTPGVYVTPAHAQAGGVAIAPTVPDGPIVPAAAIAAGVAIAPTIQEVYVTPAHAQAGGVAIAPTVISGLQITPAPAIAGIGWRLVGLAGIWESPPDPTVVDAGSPVITPAAAIGGGVAIAPTLVAGSTSVIPEAAIAFGISPDPFGASNISVMPEPAIAGVGVRLAGLAGIWVFPPDPTVEIAEVGGVLVTPAAAIAGGVAIAPKIQIGVLFDGNLSSIVGALVKEPRTSYVGALTPAGALLKRVDKFFTGALSSIVGTLAKQINKAFTGAITPTGALLKQVNKLFTGGLTPTGALTNIKTALLTVSGAITPTGALLKQVNKAFTGAVSSLVGTLTKQVNKLFTGGLTPAGTLTALKTIVREYTGAITPTGALTNRVDKFFTGAVSSIVGTLTNQVNKLFAGAITPTGALLKSVSHFLTGALTPTGTVTNVKSVILTVSGALTPSGALSKLVSKFYEGTVTSAGALLKQVNKALAGTVTTAGTLTKEIVKLFDGTVGSSGLLSKQLNRAFTGSVSSLVGTLTIQVNKIFAGALTPAGDLLKQVNKFFTGGLTPTGALTQLKSILLAVSGSITPSGALLRVVTKLLDGTATTAGTLSHLVSRAFTGTVTSAGALSKHVSHFLTGALTPTGVLTAIKTATLSVAGTVTSAGTLARSVSHFLAGALTPTGVLLKRPAILFTGAVSSTGTISRLIARSLAGAVSSTGALSKTAALNAAGALATLGTVAWSVAVTFAGTVENTGTLVRQVSRVFGGAVALSGALTNAKTAIVNAAGTIAGIAGSLVIRADKVFAGQIQPLPGTLARMPIVHYAGTAASAGALATLKTVFVAFTGIFLAASISSTLVITAGKSLAGTFTTDRLSAVIDLLKIGGPNIVAAARSTWVTGTRWAGIVGSSMANVIGNGWRNIQR